MDTITVHLEYFAALRDQRGADREALEVAPQSVADLYRSLALSLHESLVRYAVNGAFVQPDYQLRNGDLVVFIPPVAGG